MTVTIGEDTIIWYNPVGGVATEPENTPIAPQREDNTHIHFELGFALTADMEIGVVLPESYPVPDIATCDFYKGTHLKFKVKGIFQGITPDDTPATVAYDLTFGQPEKPAIFSGGETIGDDPDWDIVDDRKWEYTNVITGSCDALPLDRFTDMGDGTIRDNASGLIWLTDASCSSLEGTDGVGRANWNDANSAAAALTDGTCGLTDLSVAGDWRLPT